MTEESMSTQLRKLADFLEERPFDFTNANLRFNTVFVFCKDSESFRKNALVLGSFNKSFDYSWANATKDIGKDIKLQVTIARDVVCKKIVKRKIVPAKEEEIIPSQPEHEEEVIEWECPESIFNGEKEMANADSPNA